MASTPPHNQHVINLPLASPYLPSYWDLWNGAYVDNLLRWMGCWGHVGKMLRRAKLWETHIWNENPRPIGINKARTDHNAESPLLWLPTAQAGWWNIPNLSKWEVFTFLMGHLEMLIVAQQSKLWMSGVQFNRHFEFWATNWAWNWAKFWATFSTRALWV